MGEMTTALLTKVGNWLDLFYKEDLTSGIFNATDAEPLLWIRNKRLTSENSALTYLPTFSIVVSASNDISDAEAVIFKLLAYNGKLIRECAVQAEVLESPEDDNEGLDLVKQLCMNRLRLCDGVKLNHINTDKEILIELLQDEVVFRSRECSYAISGVSRSCSQCAQLQDILDQVVADYSEDFYAPVEVKAEPDFIKEEFEWKNFETSEFDTSEHVDDNTDDAFAQEANNAIAQRKSNKMNKHRGKRKIRKLESNYRQGDERINLDAENAALVVPQRNGDYKKSRRRRKGALANESESDDDEDENWKPQRRIHEPNSDLTSETGPSGRKENTCQNCGRVFQYIYSFINHTKKCLYGIDDKKPRRKKAKRVDPDPPLPEKSGSDEEQNWDEPKSPTHESNSNAKSENGASGREENTCDNCGRVFQYIYSFIRHSRKCVDGVDDMKPRSKKVKPSDDANFSAQCDICLKVFQLRNHYNRHMNLHKLRFPMEATITCPLCQISGLSKRKLNQHMMAKHGPEQACCPECLALVPVDQLAYHFEKQHNYTSLKHLCQECGKSFKFPCELKLHIATNHDNLGPREKSVVCEQCGKFFVHQNHLRYHVKVAHDKTKVFPCHLCSKVFYENCRLTRHLEIHSSTKPFKCKHCLYRSVRKDNVLLHCRKVHKIEATKSDVEKVSDIDWDEIHAKRDETSTKVQSSRHESRGAVNSETVRTRPLLPPSLMKLGSSVDAGLEEEADDSPS